MRYELSDDEWATMRPMLPSKTRGVRWILGEGSLPRERVVG